MANLMTFEVHERLVKKLIEVMMEEPPRGYRAVDLDQLRRVDMVVFDHLIESTREGVRVRPDGVLPLDVAMGEALTSTKFG